MAGLFNEVLGLGLISTSNNASLKISSFNNESKSNDKYNR